MINDINLTLGYSYLHDTATAIRGMYNQLESIYSYNGDYGLTLSGIPFRGSVNGNNGLYTSSGTRLNDLYNINFDPQTYMSALQQEVMSRIKPEVVLGAILKRVNEIKASYQQNLKDDLTRIREAFTARYGRELNIPEDITDITVTDISSLKGKLFSGVSAEAYKEEAERYQNMLKSAASDTGKDSSVINGALYESGKVEALQEMFQKIVYWKERYENNPTVKKLQSHLPFTPENYKAYLSHPGKLREVIREYGSLSSLQNFFLSITKLDLGQNTVENGQFSVNNLINTGINTAFQNNKFGVGFIAGVNNNPNNWLQGGLNSFITNEYSSMAGITLGTGSSGLINNSVSVNLFNFSDPSWADDPAQYLQSAYLPTIRRKDAVISFHSGVNLGSRHEIGFDLSKSFGSYQNLSKENDGEYSKSAIGGVLSGEGKSNYAIAVDYKGEILFTNVQALVRNTGLGYSNPGNAYLRRGETQFQLGLSRAFFNRKFSLKYKTDFRNQHFDPDRKFTYTTFSNRLNASWRVRRNNRVGLGYQQSSYVSNLPATSAVKGSSAVIQGDGTYRIRIGHRNITNTEVVTYQKMLLPSLWGDVYKSDAVLLAHTSLVPLKTNFLILSLIMNRSNNSEYYFNTSSVHGEASYSFLLLNKFQLVSGTGYFVNKGWNEQVGLKQQLTYTASQHILFDIGVDYKRAVKVIRPELANPVFVNASVSYRL
ncbi:MAG: hypothetical protein H3C48_13855 [Chitinophagaceae bacterium]|nr:hypothetical protein [Chitinophagaceae bacterium]